MVVFQMVQSEISAHVRFSRSIVFLSLPHAAIRRVVARRPNAVVWSMVGELHARLADAVRPDRRIVRRQRARTAQVIDLAASSSS